MTRLILVCSLACTLLLCARPVVAQPVEWRYGDRSDGIHLRILRSYTLPADAVAREPIVVIGGSATIDGTAEDDVVVVGGTLRVGPTAVVRGDVVAVGGDSYIDPRAQISGQVDETVVLWPEDLAWLNLPYEWWLVALFGATLLRLLVVLLISLLLALVAPGWIRAMNERMSSLTSAALVGLATQVLFIPALVALVVALLISVIGIPLLGAIPFLLGAAMVIWIAGFTAVAARLGARLRRTKVAYSSAPVVDVLIGYIVLTALTLIAHLMAFGPGWMRPIALTFGAVGFTIEYIAWTIGLGAAVASIFARRQLTPPPVTSPVPFTP